MTPEIGQSRVKLPVRLCLSPVARLDHVQETAMPISIRTESIERTEGPWSWYETVSEMTGRNVKRTRVQRGYRLCGKLSIGPISGLIAAIIVRPIPDRRPVDRVFNLSICRMNRAHRTAVFTQLLNSKR